MYYENYYWGMNLLWWVIWFVFIFWIFATPYDIPGQRRRKNSPLDVLKHRYAAGEITPEEYETMKKILESDSLKPL